MTGCLFCLGKKKKDKNRKKTYGNHTAPPPWYSGQEYVQKVARSEEFDGEKNPHWKNALICNEISIAKWLTSP